MLLTNSISNLVRNDRLYRNKLIINNLIIYNNTIHHKICLNGMELM